MRILSDKVQQNVLTFQHQSLKKNLQDQDMLWKGVSPCLFPEKDFPTFEILNQKPSSRRKKKKYSNHRNSEII